MTIIEQSITPKSPKTKSEDGIVVTPDFVAVIDGSTSKTPRRYSLFRSNGRYAMELIARYIRRMPKTLTCHQFCVGITAHLRRQYKRSQMAHLAQHPEERLTASAIIFSRLNREVWMIGDCQCLIGSQYYDNPKASEAMLATRRAAIISEALAQGIPPQQFLTEDTARQAIIPLMIESMKGQNRDYAVIDGFPIPEQHVRVIRLDFQPWTIVFASDGYPQLCSTLAESEAQLTLQKARDPLNIGTFQATKAFMQGQNSFDDRAYIRFNV